MHSESLLVGAAALGLALGLAATAAMPSSARGAGAGPATIPVSEIKEGMKGYGLTVFKGTKPERFDVEVVGVLHNFRPSQELILVKTPHPRLNVTKNVRGMSGSPIYFDGRLAGAYAYSWAAFQVEPVAGVTPIAPMLTEMNRPIPPGFWPLEGAAPLPGAHAPAPKHADATRFEGAPGEYDVVEHARQIEARLALRPDAARPIVPSATPLMMGGMSDRAAAFARKLFAPLGLEPMQAGGGGGDATPAKDAPEHYENGGAVGVQFVRGDVSFMGLGTVTHVQGTRLCAFGHPMMNVGDSALPATIGRVHWIFASDQHSSKIGESARPLGAMVQDRQSAIVVDEKRPPPVFPMSVLIHGVDEAPKRAWKMEVAEEKFMTAGLVAATLSSIVEATVAERRDVTWRMHSKLSVRGHGTVELDDYGVAIGGTPDQDDWVRSRVVRAVGDVINNPWELTRIDRLEAEMHVAYTNDLWRLRGAELLDAVVDAGEKARVRLHLLPLAGPEVTRVVEIAVPPELAGKEIEIEVAPGHEIVPEVAAPESLRELIANAGRQPLTARGVVVQIKLPQAGVSFRGKVAPRLPSFALDALRPAAADLGPDPFASFTRAAFPMERYVDGHARMKAKVRAVLR